MIDLLERVTLRFEREESPEQKLRKLEGLLVAARSAASRGRAPLCRPPLPATDR